MRAAALLSPAESIRNLRNFRRPQVDLVIGPDLRPGDEFDAVLIFGGDGSVHWHLPALVESQTPTLVVPVGSGNDFARSLGLGTRRAALAAWERFCTRGDNVRTVDVGEVTPSAPQSTLVPTRHLYCCVAGCGIDSATNRRANGLPRWLRARGGYILSVIATALQFRARPLSVTMTDLAGQTSTIAEPGLMVAFANAPAYGHGMRIAPRAQLDDGLLDVVFVRRAGALRLLSVFPLVYFGRHMALPEVEYRQTTRLEVASESPMDIYGDGEFLCQTPASVRVVPKALRVIVP